MGFFQEVYKVVAKIPCGKVISYRQAAAAAGNPRAARQVGWALHVNPDQNHIPCHRVVNKQGFCASGFAFGGPGIQRALLENEGVEFDGEGKVKSEYFITEL